MFYPIQMPNVFDWKFKKDAYYEEFIINNESVMCIWYMKTDELNNKIVKNLILPDLCVDLIFDCKSRKIIFIGTGKLNKETSLESNLEFIGIRFKPGAFYNLYNIDTLEVINNAVEYSKFEKTELSTIFDLKSTNKKVLYLTDFINNKKAEATDFFGYDFIDELYDNLENESVDGITAKFNYSSKQVNRLLKKQYGMTLKEILTTLRLHKTLYSLINNKEDSPFFYDLSHFIKEIKKFCGMTPGEILKEFL